MAGDLSSFSRTRSAGDGVCEMAKDTRKQIARSCIVADIEIFFRIIFHSMLFGMAVSKPS